MFRILARNLLLATMIAALAACGGGGGGGSDSGPGAVSGGGSGDSGTSTDTPTDPGGSGPIDNGGVPVPGDGDGSGDVGSPDSGNVLTVVDTVDGYSGAHQLTVQVCTGNIFAAFDKADQPNADLGQLSDLLDGITCKNTALQDVQLANLNVLGLLCQTTLSKTDGDVADDPAGFLPSCLTESATTLKNALTELPGVVTDLPGTVQGALTLLGCNNAQDPQACVTGIANDLASGQLLTSTLNMVTNALCPTAAINTANGGEIDPKACLNEVFGALGTAVSMTGVPGLDQICGDGPVRPLNCLLQANNVLSPVTDLLGNVPVAGDLINSLLGKIGEDPGNLDLLKSLPDLLAGIPVVGDLLGNVLPGGSDNDGGLGVDQLLGLLKNLQGLPDLVSQVPVLGDLLSGLAGGDSGGLPLGDLDLQSLISALTSGDIGSLPQTVQDVLNQVPVLGPLLGQILGAVNCDSGNPLECLTSASGQLGQIGDLVGQVPVLGDLLNSLLGGILGGTDGGGLPGGLDLGNLTDTLQQIPVAGDLLNQLLGTVLGGADGVDLTNLPSLLQPATGLLDNVPVLGDLLNNVLGGLLDGGALPGTGEAGLQDLLGGLLGSDNAIVPAVGTLLQQVPALGEPLVSVLDTVAGNDGLLKQVLNPISGVLKNIPGLGDLLGGLLDTLFGWS